MKNFFHGGASVLASRINSAPEARKEIAHGETVGLNVKRNSSSDRSGRNLIQKFFFRPIQGFVRFEFETHDFIMGYFQSPLRGFWRRGSAALPLITILFLAVAATAQTNNSSDAVPFLGNIPQFHLTTNGLSGAEIQGRNLAKQLADAKPVENYANTGILEIHHRDAPTNKLPFRFQTILTATNWQTIYETTSESYRVKFQVVHDGEKINLFQVHEDGTVLVDFSFPFAGSDFWLGDLGLEFFHWPEQKIIKKEFARGCGCMVLESTNPNPSPNGYSRVDCWIDEETLGIVQAKAYDAGGKLLKEFEPKSFKKDANGQWQLQDMEIRNVQTRSRTEIKFDLKQ